MDAALARPVPQATGGFRPVFILSSSTVRAYSARSRSLEGGLCRSSTGIRSGASLPVTASGTFRPCGGLPLLSSTAVKPSPANCWTKFPSTTPPSPCAAAPPNHDADQVTSRPSPPARSPIFQGAAQLIPARALARQPARRRSAAPFRRWRLARAVCVPSPGSRSSAASPPPRWSAIGDLDGDKSKASSIRQVLVHPWVHGPACQICALARAPSGWPGARISPHHRRGRIPPGSSAHPPSDHPVWANAGYRLRERSTSARRAGTAPDRRARAGLAAAQLLQGPAPPVLIGGHRRTGFDF
jgi:hypothetical protein